MSVCGEREGAGGGAGGASGLNTYLEFKRLLIRAQNWGGGGDVFPHPFQ